MLLLLAIAPALPAAQEKAPSEPPKEVYPFFRDAETRLILDYFRPGSGHLPPGLQRHSATVPAVQKLLKITGTLPAAAEKQSEPFPADLDRRLTPVPAGYRRLLVGTLALLVQDSTNLIVDLLDVVRR